jgi:spoIIIJ-associated protein
MSMEFTGKEVADAIRAACAHFQVAREQLRIEVLETGSGGIFGLIRKKAKIRAVRRQEEEAPPPADVTAAEKTAVSASDSPGQPVSVQAADSPLAEAEAKGGAASPAGQAAVREIVSELLRLMAMPSTVTSAANGLVVTCLISGPFEKELVGQDGRVIDSIQYLVRKIAARRCPESLRIAVNAGDFRERRLEELRAMASRLADEVRGSGKTRIIPALNPAERREIHLLLQDDPEVRSRSVGDGIFKRVLLFKTGGRLSGKTGTARRPAKNGNRPESPENGGS